MKKLILIFFSFLLFMTTQAMAVRHFIVDTDMGIDDIIALFYLFDDPHIKIDAILLDSNGNCDQQGVIKNAVRVLGFLKKDKIPVAVGSEKSLGFATSLPPSVIQADNHLTQWLPHEHYSIEHENAPRFLVHFLRHSKPVTILTIGSLTNLAQALAIDPSIKNKIQRIYMMAGAVNVPGNLRGADPKQTNLVAEWNIAFDPLAARILFSENLPITIIPLDMTNRYPITPSFVDRLAKIHTPTADYLSKLFSLNRSWYEQYTWYFWDPLAAYVAVNPQSALCDNKRLDVRLYPKDKEGQLIQTQNGFSVTVCERLKNPQRFEADLLRAFKTIGT